MRWALAGALALAASPGFRGAVEQDGVDARFKALHAELHEPPAPTAPPASLVEKAPASLAEKAQSGRRAVNNPGEARAARKAANDGGQKAYEDLNRNFRDQVQATTQALTGHANGFEGKIYALKDTAGQFRDGIDADTAQLDDQVAEYLKEFTNQNAQIDSKQRDLIGVVNEEASSFQESGEQLSKENQEDFGGAIQTAKEDIESDTDDLLSEIETTTGDAQKRQEKVKENVDETKGDDAETSGELLDTSREVAGTNKEQKSILGDIKRGLGYNLAKVEDDGHKIKDKVIAKAMASQQATEKDLQSLVKRVNQETRQATEEFVENAEEVGDVSEEKSEELKDLGKDISSAFMDTVNEERNQAVEVLGGAKTVLDEKKKELADSQAEYSKLAQQSTNAQHSFLNQYEELAAYAKTTAQNLATQAATARGETAESLATTLLGTGDAIIGSTEKTQQEVDEKIVDAEGKLYSAVNQGKTDVEKGIKALEDSSEKIQSETGMNEKERAEVRQGILDTVENVDYSYRKDAAEMEKVTNETDTELNTQDDQVTENLLETESELGVESGAAVNKSNDLRDAIHTSLLNTIAQMAKVAVDDIDMSSKKVRLKLDQSDGMVHSMMGTGGDIAELKNKMVLAFEGTPEENGKNGARYKVFHDLQIMQQKLDEANQALATANGQRDQTIASEDEDIREQSTKELNEMKVRTANYLHESQSRLNEILQGVGEEVNQTQLTAKNWVSSFKLYREATVGTIGATTRKVNYVATKEQEDTQMLKNLLGRIKNMVASWIRAVPRQEAGTIGTAGAVARDALQAAQQSLKDGTKLARTNAETHVEQAGKENEQSMSDFLAGVDKHMDAENARVGNVDRAVMDDSTKLAFTRAAVSGRVKSQEDELAGVEDFVKGLMAKQLALSLKQESEVAASEAQLDGEMDSDIGRLLGALQEEAAESKEEAAAMADKAKEDEEGTKSEILNARQDAEAEAGREFSRIDEMNKHVGNTEAELLDEEKQKEGELKKQSAALEADVEAGEARIKKLEEDDKDKATEGAGETVVELQGAAEALASEDSVTTEQVREIGQRVQDALLMYRRESQEYADSLSEHAEALDGSLPDYLGALHNGSVDAAKAIGIEHEKIKKSMNWTNAIIAGFDEEVKQMVHSREVQANTHAATLNDFKRMTVQEAESTLMRAQSVQEQSIAMDAELRRQMASFRGKMSKLTELGNDIDNDGTQATVEEMTKKLYSLQQYHQKLMDWSHMNKHRSAVWRDMVEHNLNALGRSITQEDAVAGKERLDTQVGLTAALKGSANSIEGELVNMGNQAARSFDHLTNTFSGGVSDVVDTNKMARLEENTAASSAHNAIDRTRVAQGRAMTEATNSWKELELSVNNLDREFALLNSVAGSLGLPLATVSDDAQQTNAQMSSMQRRMEKMAARSGYEQDESLLQTAEAPPASLLESSAEAQELAAVQAYNDALAARCMSLQEENARLEAVLTSSDAPQHHPKA